MNNKYVYVQQNTNAKKVVMGEIFAGLACLAIFAAIGVMLAWRG